MDERDIDRIINEATPADVGTIGRYRDWNQTYFHALILGLILIPISALFALQGLHEATRPLAQQGAQVSWLAQWLIQIGPNVYIGGGGLILTLLLLLYPMRDRAWGAIVAATLLAIDLTWNILAMIVLWSC